MAKTDTEALRQRILAYVATRPGRKVARNGPVEYAVTLLAKRLPGPRVPERVLAAELERMENEGLVRLLRNSRRGVTEISHVEVVHEVTPADWALAELAPTDDVGEPIERGQEERVAKEQVDVPADIDYRRLADNLLLAAFETLETNASDTERVRTLEQELRDVRVQAERSSDKLNQVTKQFDLAKAERDQAIRERKQQETRARAELEKGRDLQVRVDELEMELERARDEINVLKRQVREAAIRSDALVGMDPASRDRLANMIVGLVREGS